MAEKTLLQKRFEQSLRARGLSILAAHHQSGLSRTTLNRIRDGELVQEASIRQWARAIDEPEAPWLFAYRTVLDNPPTPSRRLSPPIDHAFASTRAAGDEAAVGPSSDEADAFDAEVSHIGHVAPSDPAAQRALAARLGGAEAVGAGVEYDIAVVAAQQIIDANAGAYPLTADQARSTARELGLNLVLIRAGRPVAGSTRRTVTVSGDHDQMPRIIHEIAEAIIDHSDRGLRHRAATIVERHFRRAYVHSVDLTTTPDQPRPLPASIHSADEDWDQ